MERFSFSLQNPYSFYKKYKSNPIYFYNMSEPGNNLIRNIIVDIIIITTVWGLLNNNTPKYFFGIGMTAYLLKKYF